MSSSPSGAASPEYADWRRRVEGELGGVSFEEALRSSSAEGIVREPLYTAADLPGGDDPAGFPGLAPFTRGRPTAPGFRIAQEHTLGDAGAVNTALVAGVEAGVGLAWLRLDAPLSSQDASMLVDGVDLDRLDLVFDAGAFDSAAPLADFAASPIRGGFGADPLGTQAAGRGEADFAAAAAVFAQSRRRFPGMRALLVATEPYHSAGASAVEELAFAVATGVEYLRRFAVDGWTVTDVAEEVLFALHTCGDFFLDVAKLRAARLLWAKVLRASGGGDAGLVVHARPSVVTRGVGDSWDHLLHSSAESFAAIAGGAESVVAAAHEGRLAVSALHVLEEEAHLARVLDPAGGSYYVEKLTDEMARDAWKLFQKLEAVGGMEDAVDDGTVDEIIEAATARWEEEVRR